MPDIKASPHLPSLACSSHDSAELGGATSASHPVQLWSCELESWELGEEVEEEEEPEETPQWPETGHELMHHPAIQSLEHWFQDLCSPQVWSDPGGFTSWPQAHLEPCSLYSFFGCAGAAGEEEPGTPQWPDWGHDLRHQPAIHPSPHCPQLLCCQHWSSEPVGATSALQSHWLPWTTGGGEGGEGGGGDSGVAGARAGTGS